MNNTITAVDLFCGAGGTSTGIMLATQRMGRRLNLTAVNHWPVAVNTHTLNHPSVTHICESVENLHPMDLVQGGRLNLLAASCECRFHSNARGGGPCNEQSRSQAWQLIRWATDCQIENILMENVREFLNWGPLNRRTRNPIKSRKGEFFRAFVATLQSLGYAVEWRIQRAADYGDPTSRERLILMARKGQEIVWPAASHGPGRATAYRTARECIDFSLKGKSIFDRKRPLCANTMNRIAAGLRRFGGVAAEPFLVILRGTSERQIEGANQSVDEPVPAITAGGGHLMMVEPFLCQTDQTSRTDLTCARSMGMPLPTIVTKQNLLLVEPMVVKYYGKGFNCKTVNEPLATVTTKDRFMLIECGSGREVAELDIRTRMLQPMELAAAHSFPASYRFTGSKADQTTQIGNSVPVELAAAHARAILS